MPTTSRAAPKSQNVCATAQTSMPAENTVAPPKSSRRAPYRRIVAPESPAPTSMPIATSEPTVPAAAVFAPSPPSARREGTVTP